jgi:hypothetical protein
MTVKTFAMLNPDWRVKVWTPQKAGAPVPWKTKEHVHCSWEGEDWLLRVTEAGENVELLEAPLQDFPGLSEVHRSDLLRWRLLHTIGGFWSDFDIVYFRSMSDLQVDMTADALLCWGETEELKDWQAIGFLAGTPGCKLFREMEQVGLALSRAPKLAYQDLGTDLLKRYALPGEKSAIGTKIGQISQYAVYPFKSVKGQMSALWNHNKELDLRKTTIGIHWFAAQRMACIKEAAWSGFDEVEKERRCGAIKWAMQQLGFIGPHDETRGIEYSIIIPYIDRPVLLHNTLMSYAHWYGRRDDLEILIIQDSKCSNPEDLKDVVDLWTRRGLDIQVIDQETTKSYGPSILFNKGVSKCHGQYVVLTSPEIYHNVDILKELDDSFEEDPDQYIVCACQSLKRPRPLRKSRQFGDLRSEVSEWFQHSIHRPNRYHFCSALKKELYLKIGGFDEQFSDGFCFDDDDFRETVIKAGIEIVQRDDLLTSHQWHGHCDVPDKMIRWNNNKSLYETKHGPYQQEPIAPVEEKSLLIPKRVGKYKVAVLCVLKSGGDFTSEYVIRLKNMVERNTNIIHEFICLTDSSNIKGCNCAKLIKGLPGWWSKIELFRSDITDAERIVYFDLDTIIVDNIDQLFELDGDFYALRPWNHKNQLRGQCGSGLMTWKNGPYEYLFDDFDQEYMKQPFGDQGYISQALDSKETKFKPIQDSISGIYSYKRECRHGGFPHDARIICFHGRPRVHEAKDLWIKEAWR